VDLNLLWKWYSSKGFIQESEKHKCLHDSQGGGRAGRSTIDLACKKTATFDIIRTAQNLAVDISNDAANCFDWMIEACQNLSCQQHGVDTNYLKIHAQTIVMLRYYVKHAVGISQDYNTHSEESPWYSAGQGAGDAAPHWVVLANSLILAYLSQADPWNVQSPDRKLTLTQGFDAFMDNTAMTTVATTHQTMANIVQIAQTNLDLWNNLLQASRGILNPGKCLWFQFNWDFHPNRTVRLYQPLHHQITVTNPPSNPQPIKCLTPSKAHQYLGVYQTTDGNYKQELTIFRQQNARFTNLLRMHPFSHQEIQTIYLQCYLPLVAYPLPVSTLPSKHIHNAQKMEMTVFLTKLGYLRTFPRAITYALIDRGGLGFRQLGHEAGIQQSLQVLKHLHLNTSIGQILQIHIQHYQLVSGFE